MTEEKQNWTHTPGPWEVYAQPIEGGQQAKDELAYQIDHTSPIGPVLYMINAGGKCPAVTGCGPTSEANARLIAAAPDIVAVLERFVEQARVGSGGKAVTRSARVNCPAGIYHDAVAALTKARGEALASTDRELGA